MPTYEYRCPNGHTFEKFYPSVSDRRKLRCPTCGKTAERVISGGTGILFKGSGFYATDYKRTAAPKEDGGGGGSDKPEKDAKPAESKPASESKPNKKTDSSDK
jgi:putative FmdB family regulatory protein